MLPPKSIQIETLRDLFTQQGFDAMQSFLSDYRHQLRQGEGVSLMQGIDTLRVIRCEQELDALIKNFGEPADLQQLESAIDKAKKHIQPS